MFTNSRNPAILTAIIEAVRSAAESAYRNYSPSFSIRGRRFEIIIIDSRTAYVVCDGVDSGIYIEDGVAVLG